MNIIKIIEQVKNNPWSAHTLNVFAFLVSNVGLLLLLESLVHEYEPLLIIAVSATSLLFLYVMKRWYEMHTVLIKYEPNDEVVSTITQPIDKNIDNYLSAQMMFLVGSEYAFMLFPHFNKLSELAIVLLAGAFSIIIAYSAFAYARFIRARGQDNI